MSGDARAVVRALRLEHEKMQKIGPRRRQVLALSAGHLPPTSGEIAAQLGISRTRAHQHVAALVDLNALRRALAGAPRGIVITAFGARVLAALAKDEAAS